MHDWFACLWYVRVPLAIAGFSRAAKASRAAFVALLPVVFGLARCPFPVVERAEQWFETFSRDHDAEFSLRGVVGGFTYSFEEAEPGGPFYSVPNCVTGILHGEG